MGTIIFWIFITLLLDTVIGNRILPGKTGVVKLSSGHPRQPTSYYKVYKWHRIMGIPIKKWQQDSYGNRSMLGQWVSYRRSGTFLESDAMHLAQLYSNKLPNGPTSKFEEVWHSKMKELKHTIDPVKQDILNQLGDAIREDREEDIIALAKLLKSK